MLDKFKSLRSLILKTHRSINLTEVNGFLSFHYTQTFARFNKHPAWILRDVLYSSYFLHLSRWIQQKFGTVIIMEDFHKLKTKTKYLKILDNCHLLPWNFTDEHPITVLVLVGWNVVRTIQKIYQFAFIHEVFHPNCLGSTVTQSREN